MNSSCYMQPDQCKGGEPALKLTLDIHLADDVTVIHCHGRITYGHEATYLSGKISGVLGETRQVILDMEGVKMIDSAGLGELVLVLMWSQARDCSIKIACPGRYVRQLLQITNLSSVFEIYPTLADALRACIPSAA